MMHYLVAGMLITTIAYYAYTFSPTAGTSEVAPETGLKALVDGHPLDNATQLTTQVGVSYLPGIGELLLAGGLAHRAAEALGTPEQLKAYDDATKRVAAALELHGTSTAIERGVVSAAISVAEAPIELLALADVAAQRIF